MPRYEQHFTRFYVLRETVEGDFASLADAVADAESRFDEVLPSGGIRLANGESLAELDDSDVWVCAVDGDEASN